MKPVYSGKVREIYDVSDSHLVIVTTDRISAFDRILPVTIKDKGIVLNSLSNFWFAKTRHIVPNHIVEERNENMPPYFRTACFKDRTVMVENWTCFLLNLSYGGICSAVCGKRIETGRTFAE